MELCFLNDTIVKAEITFMRRNGGYKEPFEKIVEHICIGYECLNSLESCLSMQLEVKNQKVLVQK